MVKEVVTALNHGPGLQVSLWSSEHGLTERMRHDTSRAVARFHERAE